MRSIFGALSVAVAVAAAPVQAATVYQSTADLTAAPVVNGYCSDCGDTQAIGGAFTLGSAATLDNVSFAISTGYGAPPITVGIYNDGGSTVGSQIFSQSYSTFNSNAATANNTTVLNVSLGGVSLSSGNYLIFFFSQNMLAIPTFSSGDGGIRVIGGGNSTFPNFAGNPVFGLNETIGYELFSAGGSVPEPANWALMIAGFGLAGATMRRRKVSVRFA